MDVNVELGERRYPIRIGLGTLASLPELCRQRLPGRQILLVADETVDALYGARVADGLTAAGFGVARATVPPGESTKSIEWFGHLCERAAEARLDRTSAICALGGGVIGDLAGFVAGAYLRGVRLVQVPTTLLAMVDSAVGGKTGVNLPQGKNLVGVFHQPSLVVADTEVLKTLPRREIAAGLAEVIKHGIIRDADLFAFCEHSMDALLAGDAAALTHVIARSCEIKAAVVTADERESGERAILNFGHTIGHAIEQVTAYGAYLHGEAVGIGMDYAARLSARVQGLSERDARRIRALIQRAGLPVSAPDLKWAEVRRAMAVDKKGAAGTPKFVLARAIGAVDYGVTVPESVLEEVWHGGRE